MSHKMPDFDDDDDDQPRPYKKRPGDVAPLVVLWLFVETTLRVMLPALACMGLGIYLGTRAGHKQAYAIVGTFIGLAIAAVLVWRQTKSVK